MLISCVFGFMLITLWHPWESKHRSFWIEQSRRSRTQSSLQHAPSPAAVNKPKFTRKASQNSKTNFVCMSTFWQPWMASKPLNGWDTIAAKKILLKTADNKSWRTNRKWLRKSEIVTHARIQIGKMILTVQFSKNKLKIGSVIHTAAKSRFEFSAIPFQC